MSIQVRTNCQFYCGQGMKPDCVALRECYCAFLREWDCPFYKNKNHKEKEVSKDGNYENQTDVCG